MRAFYKMTGSGNDFIFFDTREWSDSEGLVGAWSYDPTLIRALCARGTGVGADGVVFLDQGVDADVRIYYLNRDGSPAFCGNATLCTVQLAAQLGIGPPAGLRIATESGIVTGRLVDGVPEFDVGVIDGLTLDPSITREPGESRIGYAVVGVPHLVVLVDDIQTIDLPTRGAALRSHSWTGAGGANVNFVAPHAGTPAGWAMRTYERGVEGETLACGSGAVATAALLSAWGLASVSPVRLLARSGSPLDVTISRRGDAWQGALRGEGRLVFRGELPDL
jgi:diaminopimelate epimerase